jgi:outer membrane protein assembly factor BamB
MDDLRDLLERETAGVEPSANALEDTLQRVRRRERNRRRGAIVLSLALSAALVGGMLGTLRFGTSPDRAGSEPATPSNAVQAAPPPVPGLWVLSCERRCGRNSVGSVIRFSPESGKVVASVQVGAPSGLAVGYGSVWIISFWDSTLTRIDPSTNEVVATIELTLPSEMAPGDASFLPIDVAAGEGGVWVSSGRGAVIRVDPTTNQVVAMISVPRDTTGSLAVGEGSVWVAESVLGLYRIDPATDQVVAEIPVERNGDRLAVEQVTVGGGAVWVSGNWARPTADTGGVADYMLTNEASVVQLDPATNRPSRQIPVSEIAGPPEFAGDTLWIPECKGLCVLGIDATTGRTVREVRLEPREALVAVDEEALWVTTDEGQLRKIDTK